MLVTVGAVDVELTRYCVVVVELIVDVVVEDRVTVTFGLRDGPSRQLHARERAEGEGVAVFLSLSFPPLLPLSPESARSTFLLDKIHMVLF